MLRAYLPRVLLVAAACALVGLLLTLSSSGTVAGQEGGDEGAQAAFGTSVSQGVTIHGAKAWHDVGYKGSGIKVRVFLFSGGWL
jgi:hypothetical protein